MGKLNRTLWRLISWWTPIFHNSRPFTFLSLYILFILKLNLNHITTIWVVTIFTLRWVCILWTDVKRDSVSQARRTTCCIIPASCVTKASSRPAVAAGIIPRKATTKPAVTAIPQTNQLTNWSTDFAGLKCESFEYQLWILVELITIDDWSWVKSLPTSFLPAIWRIFHHKNEINQDLVSSSQQ